MTKNEIKAKTGIKASKFNRISSTFMGSDMNTKGLFAVIISVMMITSVFVAFIGTVPMSVKGENLDFESRVVYDMESTVWGVYVEDLNKDGYKDIIGTLRDLGKIFILFNNKDGTFGSKVEYGVGDTPSFISVGDLNNDSNNDIVVTNFYGNSVSILINKGDGTFLPQVTYATGNNPQMTKLIDVDKDNDLDMVITNEGNKSISVFKNNGNGTFANRIDYPVETDSPYHLDSADFDKDGDIDIVFSYENTNGKKISIMKNDGNGSFGNTVDLSLDDWAYSVFATDLDNDGDIDIIAGVRNAMELSVFKNNGDGTFSSKIDYSTNRTVGIVRAGDLDNDGDNDIVVTADQDNYVQIFINDGNGNLTLYKELPAGNNPLDVRIADLNNDGYNDIVCSNFLGSSVSVFINKLNFSLTVNTNQPQYYPSDYVQLSAQYYNGSTSITFQVKKPDNTTMLTYTVESDENGTASYTFKLQNNAQLGTYKVYATTNDSSANTTFNVIQRPAMKITLKSFTISDITKGNNAIANIQIENSFNVSKTFTIAYQVINSQKEPFDTVIQQVSLNASETKNYTMQVFIDNSQPTGIYNAQLQLLTAMPENSGYVIDYKNSQFNVS